MPPADPRGPRRVTQFGRDRFVFAGGRRYHFVEAGRGPALLLVPGALETYRTFNEVLPRLARRFRCLALDPLGQGDSDAPPDEDYGVLGQAERLVAVLEALELARVHAVGIGLGGSVLLCLAGRRPERLAGAVVHGGLAGLPPAADAPLERLSWLAAHPVLGRVAERVVQSGILSLPIAWTQLHKRWQAVGWSDRLRIAADDAVGLGLLRRETTAAILKAYRRSPGLEAAAAAITVPVLHLCGQLAPERPLFPHTWAVLRAAPGVTCIEVLGAGPALHYERPTWFAETTIHFLLEGALPRGRTTPAATDGVRRLILR